jgi:hypothetical protein
VAGRKPYDHQNQEEGKRRGLSILRR